VLEWICQRVESAAKAQKTPIGKLPPPEALDTNGLNIAAEDIRALTSVDAAGWKKEAEDIAAYYAKLDGRLPPPLKEQLDGLRQRLG